MKTHHVFDHDNVSDALPSVLAHINMDGAEVGSRQGERTLEILMPRIALSKPWQREVLVPGRKASIAAQIAETMWVLAGRDDVEWLSHYLPRAKDFSDDGRTWRGAYGPRLRQWYTSWDREGEPYESTDQLAHVVDLLQKDPGTRRAVISLYDPRIDTDPGKDIPCNNWLSFISRLGKLHLNVATRSNDAIWGWSGINQFEWSVLLEIMAGLTGMKVGTLTFNVTSMHIYEKHWGKAQDIVNRAGDPPPLGHESPRFAPEERTVKYLDGLIQEWFDVEEQIRGGFVADLRVHAFPEPMLRSWLHVLQWYWTGDEKYLDLDLLLDTRLAVAARMSPKPTGRGTAIVTLPDYLVPVVTSKDVGGMSIANVVPVAVSPMDVNNVTEYAPPELSNLFTGSRGKVSPLAWTSEFIVYVDDLHREKSKVYGDSWKKRGEQISILANIARKIDRLGVEGAGDSAADTVIDLVVYLIKYRIWLTTEKGATAPNGKLYMPTTLSEEAALRDVLNSMDREGPKMIQRVSLPLRVDGIKAAFEELEAWVKKDPHVQFPTNRVRSAEAMMHLAFPMARLLWGEENGHLLNREQALELNDPAVFDKAVSRSEVHADRIWRGYEVGENID